MFCKIGLCCSCIIAHDCSWSASPVMHHHTCQVHGGQTSSATSTLHAHATASCMSAKVVMHVLISEQHPSECKHSDVHSIPAGTLHHAQHLSFSVQVPGYGGLDNDVSHQLLKFLDDDVPTDSFAHMVSRSAQVKVMWLKNPESVS